MRFDDIRTIAVHELKINIRQRWTLIFAIVFGALALAISYFGLVTQAVIGFQGFVRTSASLLNLILYLAPIVALSMATLSFAGEKGVGEMLFSQPVTRTAILTGKLAGLAMALGAATMFGFGLSGLVIAANVGMEGFSRYIVFLAFALMLEAVFLSLGALIAISSGSRSRSFGYALFVWFFFVLFYDLLAMGITFLLKERTANQFLFLSLFGNPVDLARVGSLLVLGDSQIFGAAGAALVRSLGGSRTGAVATIGIAVALWAIVPIVISSRTLRRRDI